MVGSPLINEIGTRFLAEWAQRCCVLRKKKQCVVHRVATGNQLDTGEMSKDAASFKSTTSITNQPLLCRRQSPFFKAIRLASASVVLHLDCFPLCIRQFSCSALSTGLNIWFSVHRRASTQSIFTSLSFQYLRWPFRRQVSLCFLMELVDYAWNLWRHFAIRNTQTSCPEYKRRATGRCHGNWLTGRHKKWNGWPCGS